MKRASGAPRKDERDPREDGRQADSSADRTPSTDMQPEDAGTAESGNSGRASSAEGVMKQTRRTGSESRGGR